MSSSSGLNQDVACCHRAMQDLDLLATAVDVVVALILVVLERRVVVDPVRQLAERVLRAERVQQRRAAARRAYPRRAANASMPASSSA